MRADLDGGDYVAFAPPPTRGLGLLVLTFVCGLCLGLAGDRLLRPVAATPSVALVTPANTLISHTFDRPAPSHKFGVEGVTPVALQMARGTCWIFAAVAVLEHSYRMQGMAGSYLQSDQYLRLSEQVFGISILDSCAKLSDESCLIGDEVWVGNQLKPVDTQGGSASLLFWLKRLETTAAMPNSVCNYTYESGHDHLCPGLDSALSHSPLSFQTVSITTLFDREDIKSALRRHRRVMSLSTGMVTIRYLIPCTKDTALALQCDPTDASTCMACPFEPAFGGVSCCVSASRESNTMRGEFYRLPPVSHPPPIFEGGHAMALVGYSDTYRTAHGFVRGAHRTPTPQAPQPHARPSSHHPHPHPRAGRRLHFEKLVVGRLAAGPHVEARARLALARLVPPGHLAAGRGAALPKRPLARVVVRVLRPRQLPRPQDAHLCPRDESAAAPRVHRQLALLARDVRIGGEVLPPGHPQLGCGALCGLLPAGRRQAFHLVGRERPRRDR